MIYEADSIFGPIGFEDAANQGSSENVPSPIPGKGSAAPDAVPVPKKGKRRTSVMKTLNVRRSSRFFRRQNSGSGEVIGSVFQQVSISSKILLTTRPNKQECLYLTITFQSSLTFAGNDRSLPKKEASERSFNWVGSGLALKL
jgi:hypothetical protein